MSEKREKAEGYKQGKREPDLTYKRYPSRCPPLSAAQVQMILPLSPHDGVPHLLTAHTEHRVLLRRGRDESSRRRVKLG